MYPKPYIDFLVHFHGLRDYFECHEILEEHWKSDPRDNRKDYWVGLIQIAVALYHQRRGNFSGAQRMLQNSLSIVEREHEEFEGLGLDSRKLRDLLKERIIDLKRTKSYKSLNLPIIDEQLVERCQEECLKAGCKYGVPSDLANEYLVNKHMRRDRTDVIEERHEQKQLRAKRRAD
ncbi:DUF309 domain-containing protein [Alkalihalobacillus sp. AL-G]|uniref:DUF309 domain-containing protein n=1 Tax=Alkalihalobacillus sp. AL-G TaxID=2926399 RepID=UPI00272C5CA0|nr:DUF309 domain-containing protein [Alkalihalobacillus sp. AL-G]WLD91881.1 DUF309 domain-containing protein [Alkalihalobacillus sp. AL-G]